MWHNLPQLPQTTVGLLIIGGKILHWTTAGSYEEKRLPMLHQSSQLLMCDLASSQESDHRRILTSPFSKAQTMYLKKMLQEKEYFYTISPVLLGWGDFQAHPFHSLLLAGAKQRNTIAEPICGRPVYSLLRSFSGLHWSIQESPLEQLPCNKTVTSS